MEPTNNNLKKESPDEVVGTPHNNEPSRYQTVVENIQLQKDKKIVLYAYIVLIFFTLLVLFIPLTYKSFVFVYGILAFFLLIISIQNIINRKGSHMLGQFFVFLISPIFIGFGLCTLKIVGGYFVGIFVVYADFFASLFLNRKIFYACSSHY